jgi:hypothetical protein
MENCFRFLKAERIYLTRYITRHEAKIDLLDYTHFFTLTAVAT